MNGGIPQGYHTITPTLICKDASAAIALYKKALGATEDYCMRVPGGECIMHACLTIGDSKIFLCDENPASGCLASEGRSSVGFYLYVRDPDAVFRQAVSAGMKELTPVQDMFWGDRMGTVQDPFGYAWNFAAKTREVSPSERRCCING